jgi:spermidine synthase
MSQGRISRGLPWLCAALAGAAGLGAESVFLSIAGLSVGQASASALGLGFFVAGWALGAWLAGNYRGPVSTALAVLAIVAPCTSFVARALLFELGKTGGASPLSAPVALLVVALVALPQGMFLPLLARTAARGREDVGVAALIASNLFGALLGGWAIGYLAVGAWGRIGALHVAEAAACASALLGAFASRSLVDGPPVASARVAALSRLRAGWIVGVTTLWVVGLEWLCLRLGVLWIGSRQSALVTVVACSLLALALGAALLPKLVHRDERGVLEVLVLGLVSSTWPVWAAPAIEAVRARGDIAMMLALVVPALLPFGALLPTLHRAIEGESGARLGALFVHEMWGALIAGPLVHWSLVPRLGVGGAIGALCSCAGLAALALGARHRALVAASVLASALACIVVVRAPEPALATPKLVDPSLTLRAFSEDSEFAVSVVDDGLNGERTLLTDQFRAAGTGRDYRYMRLLGHLPVLLHPAPKRVAVVALGTGTTLGAVSLHREVEQLDVLEISPAVVAQNGWFSAVNRAALDGEHTSRERRPDGSARVQVLLGDGRRTLGHSQARYDVITMEPLLPDSPFGVYLYTREFYGVAKRALAPGGVFCQWVPPHALEPEVFDAVLGAFAESFEWSSAWLFGTQVILLGAEQPPALDPRRFEVDDELHRALDELGVANASGLRARFVCDLDAWPKIARPLTDVDPWIAWRSQPRGLAILTWLPDNLERLLAIAGDPPWPDVDPRGAKLVRALHEARLAKARTEYEMRAHAMTAERARAQSIEPLVPFGAAARDDAEVREFLGEIEYLAALRKGVDALQQGTDAVQPLLRAAELRPERADSHLYLGLALTRNGVAGGARAALAKACELCPRIADTPAGQLALGLGLTRAALEQ